MCIHIIGTSTCPDKPPFTWPNSCIDNLQTKYKSVNKMFSDSSTANHFCQSIASPCCDDAPLRRQNNDRIVVQKSMTRYYTVKMVSNETTIVKYSLKLMHSIYNSYFRDNLYIVISFAVITKLKAASVVVTWQPKSQATGKCTTTTKPAILQ